MKTSSSSSSGLSFRCQQVAALSHTLSTAETSRDQYLDWELSQQVLEPEMGTGILFWSYRMKK